MEDDLIFLQNGRRHRFFYQMKDDLNSFSKKEDDLNFQQNVRRPNFLTEWKTTSIFLEI